ncbi:hypothetical protein MARA_02590 (plasmid) [Mycolicibacterium arabiense]|uniref:Pyrrolo-quinoline quinone repeat domain-containing protein n=1 Tax=Mycolicibacterium arabiense TaxID=1286181 RepID=A0A7I7RS66_9MYCO|nr:hypothetical protein MARA_02590 [Mycolicibacterium arabiense]
MIGAVVIGGVSGIGHDDRPVDATMSAPTEVPAIPPELGDRRFEVTVFGRPDAQPRVVRAGPGFAVVVDDNLTAYGADGVERWHYRPAYTAIDDVHVYDDGTVLIAALSDSLIAFDAYTGQQLWTSLNEDLRGAFDGYQNSTERKPYPSLPRLLAQSTGTVMMGFDPRTGEETWRHSRGCSKTAYTPTQLLCLNMWGDHARVTVVDAATGSAGVDVRVPIPGAGRPETWTFIAEDVDSTGAGVAMTFWISGSGEQDPSPLVYLNTTSRASVPLGETSAFGGDPRGDLLVTSPGGGTVALHDAAGARRCVISPDATPVDGEFEATAWLTDQIIAVFNRGKGFDPEPSLVVFDRDCRSLSAQPVPAGTDITEVVPAPGATLMVRSDGTGTHIDGYSPR